MMAAAERFLQLHQLCDRTSTPDRTRVFEDGSNDGAIISVHAQHMTVIQRRTGAPHSVTRPRGTERAPDPCRVAKLIAKGSISMLIFTAGRFSSRDFEST